MGLMLLACLCSQADFGEIGPLERRHAELLTLLTEKKGGGLHGAYHEAREDLERELWDLLGKLPRHPAAARLLLASIDGVYLKFHANGYQGWTWHHPYFDCRKALALAERLLKEHPGSGEEALWTKLHCHRLRGLEPDEADGAYPSASVKAQSAWKADPAKAREAATELLARFPKGPYAARVKGWLLLRDEDLILPRNRGHAHPFIRGAAGN